MVGARIGRKPWRLRPGRDKLTAMRLVSLAALTVVALGCGGPRSASHVGPPAVAAAYPATRWVPASPTYLLASPTVREAQRGLRDALDALGVLIGIDGAEVGIELQALLSVDPLSPAALTDLGIDLEGGLAVFSEDLDPTFVVHLAAPEQTQGFFDRLRERGLVTQSVMVDGVEVFSAALIGNKVRVSWAVAKDWLWVHFTLPSSRDQGTGWFSASHRPDRPEWVDHWQWAHQAVAAARPALVGVIGAGDLIDNLVARAPDALACAQLFAPVSRVAFALEADGPRVSGRLAFDLGPAAARLASAILPVPEGFAAAAARAPLAAQWNLDLVAVRGWLRPCLAAVGEDLAGLERFGVRGARAVLQAFDPEDKSGAGVVVARPRPQAVPRRAPRCRPDAIGARAPSHVRSLQGARAGDPVRRHDRLRADRHGRARRGR